MAKSINLENETYWDSNSIVVGQTTLYDELYYKSGDTYAYTGLAVAPGYLTGSKASIRFSVNTPKRLDNISKITISGNISIRHSDGGYICSSLDINTLATPTCYRRASNVIEVYLALSDSQVETYTSGFTNNCPVAIEIRSGVTFTFT